MYKNVINKHVMIQLRHQAYIGVSGVPMQPLLNQEKNMVTTPLIHGILREVDDVRMCVETSDPVYEGKYKVFIYLAHAEIGMVTTIEDSPIIQV